MYDIENPQNDKNQYKTDVQKIDMAKIDQFLRSGKREKRKEILNSFFEEVGYERLESLMFRLYITMDIYISVRTFTREIGITNEEFTNRFGSIDDIAAKLATLASAYEYFSDMLEQCIIWRMEFSREDSYAVIKKAKEYISKNYACDELSLGSVAEAINLSPTYFSSIFKKDVGTNFVDYLTKIRLDKAKEFLCCTSMQVSEIAYKVGFKDYRYFSQIFKKNTGQTPREFKSSNINF
ncbi:MAG TPA: helix-turn-helix transcriptional regulator [Oscillospiraceae bacterium]|nr:helix-turn-helix transcriptional regulator [Oscillospiraceae bacterium]